MAVDKLIHQNFKDLLERAARYRVREERLDFLEFCPEFLFGEKVNQQPLFDSYAIAAIASSGVASSLRRVTVTLCLVVARSARACPLIAGRINYPAITSISTPPFGRELRINELQLFLEI